jgi:hypothetical protein
VLPLREVALRFALTTRLVWISERAEDSRVEALIGLAGLAQGLYFRGLVRATEAAAVSSAIDRRDG